MVATKKKTVTKKAVTKTAVKKKTVKAAVKKKPVTKAITRKTAKKTNGANNKIKVTHEQRHKMICEAAYYISLDKTYQTVNPTEDWLQAEDFINQICTLHTK